MPLEAILQELYRVTLNAALAEGYTQRIQLQADDPKLSVFVREVSASERSV